MNPETLAADLADRFSLRKRPRSWGGNCPACSYHGSFSMKVGKGKHPALYCSNGCTAEQLNAVAETALGEAWTPPPRPDEQTVAEARIAKQVAAFKMWTRSTPCPGTPAALYLTARGLPHLATSAALRHLGDCRHPERGVFPALIGLVVNVEGNQIATHRTYLDRAGAKAKVDPVKASIGPIWGGAIRLDPVAAEIIVGEGIETAASAGTLMGLPAWAAISAGNLAAGLVLPQAVRSVVIAADPDPPGEKAARDAALRWNAEGRRVRIARTGRPGFDFNDLLQERAHE